MVRWPSFLLLFMVALTRPTSSPASALVGIARVVDGDTIAFGGQRVRIWGIDAPEKLQTCREPSGRSWSCGMRARQALAGWIAGRAVACRMRDRDHNGRPVASCVVGDQDLASWLVEQGWAFDYARYSRGAYAPAEQAAQVAQRNIWSGEVMRPWLWRAGQRRSSMPPVAPPSPACPLKGNINASGGHIVHAPGQRDYAAVRIDPARGERWFCSWGEARRAGWRAAAR